MWLCGMSYSDLTYIDIPWKPPLASLKIQNFSEILIDPRNWKPLKFTDNVVCLSLDNHFLD